MWARERLFTDRIEAARRRLAASARGQEAEAPPEARSRTREAVGLQGGAQHRSRRAGVEAEEGLGRSGSPDEEPKTPQEKRILLAGAPVRVSGTWSCTAAAEKATRRGTQYVGSLRGPSAAPDCPLKGRKSGRAGREAGRKTRDPPRKRGKPASLLPAQTCERSVASFLTSGAPSEGMFSRPMKKVVVYGSRPPNMRREV